MYVTYRQHWIRRVFVLPVQECCRCNFQNPPLVRLKIHSSWRNIIRRFFSYRELKRDRVIGRNHVVMSRRATDPTLLWVTPSKAVGGVASAPDNSSARETRSATSGRVNEYFLNSDVCSSSIYVSVCLSVCLSVYCSFLRGSCLK